MPHSIRRRVLTAGLATVASVGLLAGTASAAFAADGSGDAPAAEGRRPKLTDEQKACLESHGAPKPTQGEDGKRVPLTDEQRAAVKAAAEACGITLPGPPRGPRADRPQLTDEQKSCLEGQGITKPAKPADGERPARPTEEQRAKFKAAAEACGITLAGPPG